MLAAPSALVGVSLSMDRQACPHSRQDNYHPPPRSGGGGPRVARWRGLRLRGLPLRTILASLPRAPSTAFGGPPPPLRFTPRGRISKFVLATRPRPSFVDSSPPPSVGAGFMPAPPPYPPPLAGEGRVGARGSGTPTGANIHCPRHARRCCHLPALRAQRALIGARSPVGVPPRLLPGGFRPFRSAPGQASWDAARAPDPVSPPQPGGERPCAADTGVTRARLSQSRESTSRTGRSAGQHDARSCPGAECIVPRAGTALAPLSGVPSAEGVPR
jgi:hypothetical protein